MRNFSSSQLIWPTFRFQKWIKSIQQISTFPRHFFVITICGLIEIFSTYHRCHRLVCVRCSSHKFNALNLNTKWSDAIKIDESAQIYDNVLSLLTIKACVEPYEPIVNCFSLNIIGDQWQIPDSEISSWKQNKQNIEEENRWKGAKVIFFLCKLDWRAMRMELVWQMAVCRISLHRFAIFFFWILLPFKTNNLYSFNLMNLKYQLKWNKFIW